MVLVASASVFALLAARFFRWKHLKALMRAELPRIRSVRGEFAGAKAKLRLADAAADERFDFLISRIDQLQLTMDAALHAQAKERRRKKT